MSRVRNSDTALEKLLCEELIRNGVTTYTRNNKTIFGKPDIAFIARKIAVFCDGDFWHGYDWANAQNEIKSNRDFWIPKIERNMHRDLEVTTRLQEQGWTVLRFWGHEILKEMDFCISTILDELRNLPRLPYRTIDLCAGIGGIRRGFELTGRFRNVLSSEIDKYACKTYQHLFGDDPYHDLTSEEFKNLVSETPYDVLLAGFPCQTFSRVGLQEGFDDEEKGKIFFHISEIIQKTRPFVIFLENVDRLVTHDEGRTFRTIIETLVKRLGYHIIGVEQREDGGLQYALIGFSRIQPAMTRNDVGFVDVKDPDTRWYPAYEVRGEGIFIEFNQEDIDNWVETHPAVNERVAILNRNYATSFIGKNHPRTITPKFLMLHTLSHLLISQLSFECGYSIASLSERLYCAEESDGKNMAGIFIYTASGDAEGTLGGLVRQGRPDAFPGILRKAIANAKTCSNDPVCIMSRGQGRDSLNLAACHACGLLPETCCEERNAFLDRGVIVGTYENPGIGFWANID